LVATAARGRSPEGGSMTAAQRRLKAWAKMTSKQKLADMEKEDKRRKGRK
jgi:hypothetical protein